MDLDFDYDPEEIVRIDNRSLSLVAAVAEYVLERRSLPATQLMEPALWLRDEGKTPLYFDNNHIETLAAVSPFRDAAGPDEPRAKVVD